jgi:chemotaxis protein histidine kinase CheA
MSLDEKPDFSEPELSEDDMKRLSQMGLDNIIEQVTTDTSSVDDLFDDTKEEKDNINNQNNKEKADEKKADVNMAVDTVDNDEMAADSAKSSKKGRKKQKKEKTKKNNIFSVIKSVFFENLDEEDEDLDIEKKEKSSKQKVVKTNKTKKSVDDVRKDDDIRQSAPEPQAELQPENESIIDENRADIADNINQDDENSVNNDIYDDTSEDKTEKNDLPEEPDRSKDENVQLIKEMYGDKDNLDENIAPKKGLIAKLKYRIAQLKKKNAEEDKLEEEAELADIEEQKKKKEEKQAAAAVKKENAKKEKEVKAAEKKKAKDAKAAKKAAKPKKEKKPKPEPKPGDILKIKPKSIMLFITLVASVIVLISLLNTTVSYTTAISKAKTNLENGDYSKVYESLSGMKLNKSDETLYRQATLITYVTRQYESYQNYMEMDMKTEAINALVKGLARYDTYYNEANSLGVGNQMKEARAQIIQAFNDTFKISESEAVSLVAMSDNNFTQYYRKIEAYGKAR